VHITCNEDSKVEVIFADLNTVMESTFRFDTEYLLRLCPCRHRYPSHPIHNSPPPHVEEVHGLVFLFKWNKRQKHKYNIWWQNNIVAVTRTSYENQVLRVLCCSVCLFVFCTGHFVMVTLNLICLHGLQHSFFKHLFNWYDIWFFS